MDKAVYEQGLKRNIKLFYISDFLYNIYFTGVIWVAFYRQFMNFTEMALFTSFGLLIVIILQMPTGAFADMFGRRFSCVLGSVLRVVGYVIMAFAPDKLMIFVGGALVFAGDAFISGANTSLLYDSLLELKREKEFSKIRANTVILAQVSVILGMLAGSYLFDIWKGLPYLICAVEYLLTGIVYFLFIEPRRDTEHFTVRRYFRKMKLGFMEIFKNSSMIELTALIVFLGAITYVFQTNFNQIYASALGFTETQKGWMFSIFRFFNAFIVIKLFKFDRLFNRSNTFVLFAVMIGLSILPGFIKDQTLGMLILLLTTGWSSLRFIIVDRLVNHEIDPAHRATALSAQSMLLSLTYIILISIFGPMFDTHFAGWAYTIIGIFTLLVILPLAIYLRKKNAALDFSSHDHAN